MGIIEEYFTLQRDALRKYGSKAVVIIQVGSFYEIYGVDSTISDITGFAEELSTVLNIKLTLKDGNRPHSASNTRMIGFPIISATKNVGCLVSNGYTVLKVDQITVGGKIERKVTSVINSTMQITEETLNRHTSNIVTLYIEYQGCVHPTKPDTYSLTTGASIIDISTGDTSVLQFLSDPHNCQSALIDIYRFVTISNPQALIIHVVDLPQAAELLYTEYLHRTLDTHRVPTVDIHINKLSPNHRTIAYQNDVLHQTFGDPNTIRDPMLMEKLGLETMTYGRISLITLIEYCRMYDSTLVSKLKRPSYEWFDQSTHLALTHNCIQQLNIVPTTKSKSRTIDSLLSVLDKTHTNMGRRLLLKNLQSPMKEASEIQRHYDMTQELLTNTLYHTVSKALKGIPDIEQLHRRLVIGNISPRHLALFYSTLTRIVDIYITVMSSPSPTMQTLVLSQTDTKNLEEFFNRFPMFIDFPKLTKCSIDRENMDFEESYLKPGYFPDIDSQFQTLAEYENHLAQIVRHLEGHLSSTRGTAISMKDPKKKDEGNNSTVLLTTTSKASMLAKSRIDVDLCGVLSFQPYTASQKIITSDVIVNLCTNIDTIKTYLRGRLYHIYNSLVQEMSKYSFIDSIIHIIARIDLQQCYARCAVKYNYVKPVIQGVHSDPSFIDIKDLRHPILERIVTSSYVTNDVALGCEGSNRGMLLYGANTSGKTSILRATALCVIMAQAGMYVPASSMAYRPYSAIITRLTASDDMFSAKSSFYVEMSELRTVLKTANSNTLVVADEISRGTMPSTGAAIAAAAVLWLLENRATFMFTTHLRDIVEVEDIKNSNSLRVCHLTVDYDEATGSIVYSRKLQDGLCSPGYGLVIARSIGIPLEFINKASAIQSELEGAPGVKRSRYNKNVIVRNCALCSSTKGLETHHILEQHTAVDGFVGHVPLNSVGNLVVLCDKCHDVLHKGGGALTLVETSNGITVGK